MPAPSRLSWYKWEPADFLFDEEVQGLTPTAELAYRRLLDHAWLAGDCSLPDDPGLLAALARVPFEQWNSTWICICKFFRKSRSGRWYNPRQMQDRRSAVEVSIARSKTAELAHKRKRELKKLAVANAHANTDADTSANTDANTVRGRGRGRERERPTSLPAFTQEVDLNVPTRKPPPQLPVAGDRTPEPPEPVPTNGTTPTHRDLPWNDRGEITAPGLRRHPDFPWIAERLYAHVAKPAGRLREAYIAEFDRVPEEPPPGWVNTTGAWQRRAVPEPQGGAA
jgi:uncharacterized protein YdaU (DUF1376 family)